MTTPYEAYNRGAIALAEHFDIGRVSASDFVLENNPYPADETWTLFKPSGDLDCDALDRREAKLVHESGAELTFTIRRRLNLPHTRWRFVWVSPAGTEQVFNAGWYNYDGWKLYIKGELPTKRVTADTLQPAYKEEA